jgi:hypothetical protein
MAFAQRLSSVRQPIPIDRKAADNLRFIRDTMERASSFTAVPGWGGVAIGCTALLTGGLAWARTPRTQFHLWLGEAAVALLVAFFTVRRKSKKLSQSLKSSPARRALLSFVPPLLAGGALSVVLEQRGLLEILPGLWLLLYGAAVVTGGAFSVRIVPLMGLCFILLGCGALSAVAVAGPPGLGNLSLMLGFGLIHIVFGVMIARRHGG